MTAPPRLIRLLPLAVLLSLTLFETVRLSGQHRTTAIVSGTVVDDATDRPIKAATLLLTRDADGLRRVALSDSTGMFAFNGIPPGRYALTISKESYVDSPRTAQIQTPRIIVALAGGETEGLTVRMKRGAVLSGAITNTFGSPLPGVRVTLLKCNGFDNECGGGRVLKSLLTNARGEYRFFGVSAGIYVVGADSRLGDNPTAVETLDQAALEWAEKALNQDPLTPTKSLPLSATRIGTVNYGTTYYPDVLDVQNATRLHIAESEERQDLNINLRLVPSSTVSGIVSGAASSLRRVALIPESAPTAAYPPQSSAVEADGAFAISNVLSGRYRLIGRSTTTDASSTWVSLNLTVDGSDLEGIALQTKPGIVIAGRVRVSPAAPADMSGLRVELLRADQRVRLLNVDAASATTNKDGAFMAGDLIPGRYQATVQLPARLIGRLWVSSVLIGGVDALDSPVEISADTTDIVIELVDQPSRLTGVLQRDDRVATRASSVLAFPADAGSWTKESRRIALVWAANDGSFVLSDLPSGEYCVTGVDAVSRDDLDSSLLTSLRALARRITISGRATHNIGVVPTSGR